MSITGKSLADGVVAGTKGTIYQVKSETAHIKTAHFYNTNAIAQTLNIYVKRKDSTSRLIETASLSQYATFELCSGGLGLTLSLGDLLEADTTTASAIDYVLTGTVE